MKKRRTKKSIIIILMIISFIIFCYSACMIINWFISNNENKKIKDDINEYITEKKDETKVDFKKLKEKNSDTVAYLKVNGTNIEYVVVKGKDNKYYLNHNFNKEYNMSGWIFADYHNKYDDEDKNLVVYGHNIKDGSMFGTLKNTLNRNWQEKRENLQITYITEKKEYIYQVFSTYTIDPEEYYINTMFNSNDEYLEFLKKIKTRSNYDYKVDVNSNDKILTLSTCSDSGKNRVVLHAKKTN